LEEKDKAGQLLINELEEMRWKASQLQKEGPATGHDMMTLIEEQEKWRKYQFIANTAKEFMTIINRNYTYEFVNDAYCKAHGRSSTDFSWKTVADVWGRETFDKIIKNYLDRCFAGENVRYEDWFQYQGQGLRCYYVTYYPYFDENRDVSHAVVVAYDITEQKEAEKALRESEEKYRNIFENAVEGIFQVSPEGTYISANPALARMIGYNSPEEMMRETAGSPKQGFVEFETKEYFENLLKEQGIVRGFETQHYRADGSVFWVSVNARAVYDATGSLLYHEGTIEDISARKFAQEELERTLLKLRKNLIGTIKAMSLVTETRDPYTAGHQKRVSDLARNIAQEMNLSDDTIDSIRMAGSIHDIGKLSVPAEILSKPTKLSDMEFALIKVHPQAGYDILKGAELPYPVAEICHQHHERLDGKGYPQGLKGEEILLEARIVTVADVVEAISSHRPYRPALGIDMALEEIEKNKDIFYDSRAVDACIKLFREKGYKFAL
jgi:PAS domain S-box-containing protein